MTSWRRATAGRKCVDHRDWVARQLPWLGFTKWVIEPLGLVRLSLTSFVKLKATFPTRSGFRKVGLGHALALVSLLLSRDSRARALVAPSVVVRLLSSVSLTFPVDDRVDGSGSECNSVVPKKRRRRDNHQTTNDEFPTSPRSSRSTASSRSSSLLQFESLERTCATLSPSSYSFDSLEYSNRSNASHPENGDSPDSLEQDYDKLLPNGLAGTLTNHFPKIRPYRSFESLDTCQKDESFGQGTMSNGFAPLYLQKGADLSRKNNQRSR